MNRYSILDDAVRKLTGHYDLISLVREGRFPREDLNTGQMFKDLMAFDSIYDFEQCRATKRGISIRNEEYEFLRSEVRAYLAALKPAPAKKEGETKIIKAKPKVQFIDCMDVLNKLGWAGF
jgi:hypothetical protein